MDEEIRAEQLVRTRGAAAALIEDLAHIRKVLEEAPSRDELRRLSSTLRRILSDRDLTVVATPRIGRVFLQAPDNKRIIKVMERLKRPPTFFASAGINLFGMRLRTMVLSMGDVLQPNEMKELFSVDVDTSVKLKLDGFLSQRVLMFQGEWASRRDVIKYMANIASGVHSSTPSEPAEVLLHKIQRGITYSQRTGVYFNTKITTGIDLPFRYDPDGLDVVLIELMAAASFLVSSDDTARLEDAIRDELRLFQPSSRSRNRSPGS